jgi:hypothetical protein
MMPPMARISVVMDVVVQHGQITSLTYWRNDEALRLHMR